MKHETPEKNSQSVSIFNPQTSRHEPVLLKETIKFLDPKPGEFFIDGTIDGGGHAAAILEKILPGGKLLGIDLDEKLLGVARERISAKLSAKNVSPPSPPAGGFGRAGAAGGKIENLKLQNLILVHGNYADLPEILKEKKLGMADGLFLDLGFSSEQLESGRGFSFIKDEPLFMTYSKDAKPLASVLKELKERDLADIIFKLSGEKFSRRIAAAIKTRLKTKPILTTKELRESIVAAVPRNYERGRIDPATRTFQALRIYMNKELENLEDLLQRIFEAVKPGGRTAIISFHSLEDKIVKNFFRDFAKAGKMEILTKKPVSPSDEEIEENPRSRSAKLRAIRII